MGVSKNIWLLGVFIGILTHLESKICRSFENEGFEKIHYNHYKNSMYFSLICDIKTMFLKHTLKIVAFFQDTLRT